MIKKAIVKPRVRTGQENVNKEVEKDIKTENQDCIKRLVDMMEN